MTREEFEKKVLPASKELFEICQEHGLALVMDIVFNEDEDSFEHCFSVHTPEGLQVNRHRLARILLDE